MGGSAGGIVAQDYHNRGLMTHVWIVHNTLLKNHGPAIKVQGFHRGGSNVIAFNAIIPSETGAALIPPKPEAALLAMSSAPGLRIVLVMPRVFQMA